MTDPFTALSSPPDPVDPGDELRARIRARVVERLGRPPEPGTEGGSDTSTATTASAGGHTMSTTTERATVAAMSPYLSVTDGRAAIDFYVEVFGAEPVGDVFVDADGRVGHAELRFGDTIVMLADEYPDYGAIAPVTLGGTGVALHVAVPDAATTVEQARRRGATVVREVEEQFYGDVAGTIVDPWGHRWTVRTPRGDALDHDELVARSAGEGFELVPTAEPAPATSGRSRTGELGYVRLPVADLERGMAFFGELLGWEFSQPGSQGGVHILNSNFPGSIGPSGGDGPEVTFVVDDLEAAVATVRRLGGTADDPDGPPAWRVSGCTDGAGVEFTLVQAAPGPYPVGNEL